MNDLDLRPSNLIAVKLLTQWPDLPRLKWHLGLE